MCSNKTTTYYDFLPPPNLSLTFMLFNILAISYKNYLILLAICLRVVRVWIMLEKLSHICHDGLLIRLFNIHIYRKKHKHIQLIVLPIYIYTYHFIL